LPPKKLFLALWKLKILKFVPFIFVFGHSGVNGVRFLKPGFGMKRGTEPKPKASLHGN
jgi:hypothetical protein